jgi:phosphate:Na+ symporter
MPPLELSHILHTAGGLGLFLLGMTVMTDSLRKLAGERIRSALLKFTKTPSSGAISGALATALVQSSSATTLAAVGFVGAGLMSFHNALGVIFGANIGTTITGWMVVLLGFKWSIGSLAAVIVLAGVLIKLFARDKWALSGLAMAGFGVLFIGIATMQEAMAGMIGLLDFSQMPAHSLLGLLQLVLIGLVFTSITQSSSAGVALTLSALYSDLIVFEQAVALVIGMDIGTTVKSLLATLGGTVGAKRTALSHVVYNLATAILGLMLITPYTQAWGFFSPQALSQHAELALVGFHTLFNLLGVILILPFSAPFAPLISRAIPEDTHSLTRQLETQLLNTPDLALNAAQHTLHNSALALSDQLHALMSHPTDHRLQSRLSSLQNALDETEHYVDRIHLSRSEGHLWKRLVSIIHTLDHLQRLHERCEEESDRAEASKQFSALSAVSQRLENDLQTLRDHWQNAQWEQAIELSRTLYHHIRQQSEGYRHRMVQQMGQGTLSAEQCRDSLEAVRWMERVSKHLYRISYHLQKLWLSSGR